ncbi:MAG: O-antigen ligase family protein [Acidobacteria bacterium]|nr:O-antigen ligase family protein [Acidobacteriota bacterium]
MMVYRLLIVFFFLEYVRPTSYVPALSILHLNSLALYSVALASLLGKQGMSNEELFGDINTRLLLVFLGLLALSVVVSDSSLAAFDMFRALFEYILLFVALAKQASTLPRIKGLFLTIVAVNIIVALLTPSLLLSQERQYIASGNFLGDANDFALSVNVAITLCLFLVFESTARRHTINIGLLLFLIFLVVVTQSRGGTVALMAVGFYYWIKGSNRLRTLGLAVAAALIVAILAPPTYWQRMNDIVNTREGSAAGRLEAWNGGLRMALDHPLFGVGAGRFAFAYGSSYRTSPTTPYQTAHSIYFLNLGELGFPGLFILIALITANFVANAKLVRQLNTRDPSTTLTERRLLASLSAAMMAYAVGGAFLSAVYFPHLYVIAGLSTASRWLIRRQSLSASTGEFSTKRPGAPEVHVHWSLQPRQPRTQPQLRRWDRRELAR